MSRQWLPSVCMLAGLLCLGTPAGAEVQLTTVIGQHCVLQRDMPVAVWGRAAPGEAVTVRFAGQKKQTSADRFGRWRIELDPMPASSEGRELTVEGPANSIRVQDVWVGDVFLTLTSCWYVGEQPTLSPNDKDPAQLPPIAMQRPASVHESNNHSPRAVEEFSATAERRWSVYVSGNKYFAPDAFYLALELAPRSRAAVGVVGLGASSLESMTPPDGFLAAREELDRLAAEVATWLPHTPQGKAAYLKTLQDLERWVERTRAVFGRPQISFRDFTQPPRLPGPPAYQRAPTTFYNHVIHRFAPAAIRGVIVRPMTYNLSDPKYEAKARALITGLRNAFSRDDLPVCFIQMHSPGRYERPLTDNAADWLEMRRAQASLAGLPNTTVIATYDVPDAGKDSPQIGRRMGRWAAWLVTGRGVPAGPQLHRHRIEQGRATLEFEQVGSGLAVGRWTADGRLELLADGKPGGFELCDAEGQWHAAAAEIQGSSVVVSCAEVENPTGVRYAWTAEPGEADLYNRDGFPALPFTAP